MLVAMAYHAGELRQVRDWMDWALQIGGAKNHRLILLAAATVAESDASQIRDMAKKVFKEVEPMRAQYEDPRPWPVNPNLCFRTIFWHVNSKYKCPFFWCEPDCVPVRDGFLDLWQAEYDKCGKPFMGWVVPDPLHLSGCAVYCHTLYDYSTNVLLVDETPWDVVDPDKIVPHAHSTRLFCHVWFHNVENPDKHKYSAQATRFLAIQDLSIIHPESVWLHRNKDGSLIRLLRERRQVIVPVESAPKPSNNPLTKGNGPIHPPDGVCGVLVRTYATDAPWLFWALGAFNKFAFGFGDRVVVAPRSDAHVIKPMAERARFRFAVCDDHPNGYLHQQVTKLEADRYLPDSQFIFHLDSDTLFTRPTGPDEWICRGHCRHIMEAYARLENKTPWQSITAKALGAPVEFEFMRRHPFVYPRWLYAKAREHLERTHGVSWDQYILAQPERGFSEFNYLGAYAYAHHWDQFIWHEVPARGTLALPALRQFWSWGGITEEAEREILAIMADAPKPVRKKHKPARRNPSWKPPRMIPDHTIIPQEDQVT